MFQWVGRGLCEQVVVTGPLTVMSVFITMRTE